LLKDCQRGIIQHAIICKLLGTDDPETPDSMSHFIDKVTSLDRSVRDDIICARLIGEKELEDMHIPLWLYNSWEWDSGKIDFLYQFPSKHRKNINIIKEKVEKFEKLKNGLPKNIIAKIEFDCWDDLLVDMRGFIDSVRLTKTLFWYTGAEINIINIRVTKVYYKEKEYKSLNEFLKEADRKTTKMNNEAWEYFMKFGQKDSKQKSKKKINF
jgi:hypothetical protein